MYLLNKNWILLFSFFLTVQAWAWPPTFGPEFNFTSEEIKQESKRIGTDYINNQKNVQAQMDFFKKVLAKCQECKSEEIKTKYDLTAYKIILPEGWFFVINLDPAVVEVQMSPMTLDQIIKYENQIQNLVFDTAKEIGLHSSEASGHLHIGLQSAFAEDPLLYRNFIVDWVEHSKMAYLISNADPYNAPTIEMLGLKPKQNFRVIMAAFDGWLLENIVDVHLFPETIFEMNKQFENSKVFQESKLKDKFLLTLKDESILSLTKEINSEVYYKTFSARIPTKKYQNLNLEHINGDPSDYTVELRSVHEVKNAKEYILLTSLIQGRLTYLKKMKTPIPFKGIKKVNSHQKLVNLFYEYAINSGLSWAQAKILIDPEYQNYQPKFKAPSCSRIFL